MPTNPEQERLNDDASVGRPWRNWGAFLTERQWGSVREDYSEDGTAWDYFPHDDARSRAYRWGEDGIFGWCDRFGHINFAPAFWNGKDPILKERLFGLTNSEGNHGEDVKELYYFIDGLPTGSYMKALYKYPCEAYPYQDLIDVNRQRQSDLSLPEYELIDTGIFDQGYFDITVEYAKINPNSVAIRVVAKNCSSKSQELHLLGQVWFRNCWSWDGLQSKPDIKMTSPNTVTLPGVDYGDLKFHFPNDSTPLFTENNTNKEKIFQCPSESPFVKDAFHRYIINSEVSAVNPEQIGSKFGAAQKFQIEPNQTITVYYQLTDAGTDALSDAQIETLFNLRIKEADQFYNAISPDLDPELALVQRQSFASLIWSKQHYHFNVKKWLEGDALQPPPNRRVERNKNWQHVRTSDIISMPDTWEYPWFAAWDLGFQTVAFSMIDPAFAKNQLILLMREWMMHPNGQVPAYEWAFGDVNPPVYAWAAWRIYTIDRKRTGAGDREFLERIFHKLLINFTWWVNRKDSEGNNVFQGGFLGLDNIGVFDRNMPFPDGVELEQSDGTSWMGMFCLEMLTIALELAKVEAAYEDVAIKFFEHFILIAEAMNGIGPDGNSLWDDEDGFYYDILRFGNKKSQFLKVRSAVGIIPLFAVTTMLDSEGQMYPRFWKHVEWVFKHNPNLSKYIGCMEEVGKKGYRLLSIFDKTKLERVLGKLLSESEFLSPYGIRALSKYHSAHPYILQLDGHTFSVDYEPGESTTGQFGGNSNWRGPLWMPVNFLLIESLQQFDYYYGDSLTTEFPIGSGKQVRLNEIAAMLEHRIVSIFLPDENGNRPVHNEDPRYSKSGDWGDLVLFYEYFHGDSGRGVGASHQTGWTALVAKLIDQRYQGVYSNLKPD